MLSPLLFSVDTFSLDQWFRTVWMYLLCNCFEYFGGQIVIHPAVLGAFEYFIRTVTIVPFVLPIIKIDCWYCFGVEELRQLYPPIVISNFLCCTICKEEQTATCYAKIFKTIMVGYIQTHDLKFSFCFWVLLRIDSETHGVGWVNEHLVKATIPSPLPGSNLNIKSLYWFATILYNHQFLFWCDPPDS